MTFHAHATTRSLRRVLAAIGCTLALATVTAACGSDGADGAGDGVASLGTQTTAPKADDNATGDSTTDDSATEDSTVTPDSVDPEDAFVEYTACMRDNGFDMPDPEPVSVDGDGKVSSGGPVVNAAGPEDPTGDDEGPAAVIVGPGGQLSFDPSDPAYAAANEVCQPILDAAITPIDLDPEVEAERRQEMLDFAECMREHGIDMPDPVFGDNGTVSVQIGDPNAPGDGPGPGDEEFEAAQEACGDLMSGGPVVGGQVGSVGGDD